ncbi:hypothetical protein F5Y12DRAFT_745638 [Xylaria sp. FL1777]|nr:hypothetical protein F5Y12DRAFT_745638 [Xylaria sp. FL1777]
MLRISRLLQQRILSRIFSLGARVRPPNSPQPEVLRIQRVKFRRKRPRISNFLITAAFTYAFYEITTRTLIALVDEAEFDLTEEELRELEEEEDEPFFIPFPGFTKTVESLPYRGSDPEWQAYVKASRNKPLMDSIRVNLAEIARRVVAGHPRFVGRREKTPTISGYWLTVEFPSRPPPTFVRQGLAFGGGNGITWTSQPVDSGAVFWTQQALWPSALTSSLWSFTNALILQNATNIAKFFGSQTDPTPTVQEAVERIYQQFGKPPGKPSSTSSPQPSQDRADGRSTGSPLPSIDKRSTGTTTPETLGKGANIDNAIPNISSAKLYMTRTAQEHMSGPWDKFKKSFAQKWRWAPAYPPRGSIKVSGLVEIRTQNATLVVDCKAWWDPQTKKYDSRTLSLAVRSIRPKMQAPLR